MSTKVSKSDQPHVPVLGDEIAKLGPNPLQATVDRLRAELAELEAENRALREAGDWLFTALNLAQAENTMCLDHFREAEMTTWVQGLMTVRGKSQAALDQWTETKATLAQKENEKTS